MMKCKDFDRLMNLYLDGELTEKLHNELKRHIENCPSCKEQFDLSVNIQRELKELEQPVLSKEFDNKLYLALCKVQNAENASTKRKALQNFFSVRTTSILATAVVIVIVTFGAFQSDFFRKPNEYATNTVNPSEKAHDGAVSDQQTVQNDKPAPEKTPENIMPKGAQKNTPVKQNKQSEVGLAKSDEQVIQAPAPQIPFENTPVSDSPQAPPSPTAIIEPPVAMSTAPTSESVTGGAAAVTDAAIISTESPPQMSTFSLKAKIVEQTTVITVKNIKPEALKDLNITKITDTTYSAEITQLEPIKQKLTELKIEFTVTEKAKDENSKDDLVIVFE